MIEISDDMINSFHKLNGILRNKKNNRPNKKYLRNFLQSDLGTLLKIERLGDDELKKIEQEGGLCAVDGSVNRTGGASPHYLDFFKGTAKNTAGGGEVSFSDFYSPLVGGDISEDNDVSLRDTMLAEIEMRTAIKAIFELKPRVLMMDGSLLRYRIFNKILWEELKSQALENNIILTGVIKDIKTSFIGENLGINYYDRELLYGVFDIGEFFIIKPEINKSKKAELTSGFLRASDDPNVVGVDIIEEQEEFLTMAARLSLSLTPINSRGVPLLLDIVDKEVKITDDMLKACLENYLDRDLYELFLMSERQKRN